MGGGGEGGVKLEKRGRGAQQVPAWTGEKAGSYSVWQPTDTRTLGAAGATGASGEAGSAGGGWAGPAPPGPGCSCLGAGGSVASAGGGGALLR